MAIINHLSKDNQLDLICEIIIRLKPEIYLELGIKKGNTISSISPHAGRSIGVDINKPKKKIKGYEFYEMTTDKFFEKINLGEIHLPFVNVVFIDANHNSKYVLKDFYNVLPMVKDQGIIILHDTYPKNKSFISDEFCGDSYKIAWDISIKNIPEIECCTIPIYPGFTIIRKRQQQLLWS
jgi:hypothetical protein